MSRRSRPKLSIIIPCYNEEEIIQDSIKTILGELNLLINKDKISKDSYIFLIDDGSSDKTWEIIKKINENNNKVKGLKFTNNFGHQSALMAGIMHCKDESDASITIDADMQQEPNKIINFIENYCSGSDIVYGVRYDRKTDGKIKKITALFFYKLARFLGINIIPNHADYRLLSSRAANLLTQYQEPDLILRAICPRLGLKNSIVYFNVKPRSAGKSKYTFLRMLGLAVDSITSFTVVPLRMITALGALVIFFSILMGIYILYIALIIGDVVKGWTSTIFAIYFIGGIQILCIAIIGEYIGKILIIEKNRPRYHIDERLL